MNRVGKGIELGEESRWTGAQEGGRGAVLDALRGENSRRAPKGTCAKPHGSRSSVTRSLACRTGHDSAWRGFPEDDVRLACASFPRRLQACGLAEDELSHQREDPGEQI